MGFRTGKHIRVRSVAIGRPPGPSQRLIGHCFWFLASHWLRVARRTPAAAPQSPSVYLRAAAGGGAAGVRPGGGGVWVSVAGLRPSAARGQPSRVPASPLTLRERASRAVCSLSFRTGAVATSDVEGPSRLTEGTRGRGGPRSLEGVREGKSRARPWQKKVVPARLSAASAAPPSLSLTTLLVSLRFNLEKIGTWRYFFCTKMQDPTTNVMT